MWNNDIDLKIIQLNSTLMNNSIDSLDVSTVSERETESESEPEIIALIYQSLTIQTSSSSQLEDDDFIGVKLDENDLPIIVEGTELN